MWQTDGIIWNNITYVQTLEKWLSASDGEFGRRESGTGRGGYFALKEVSTTPTKQRTNCGREEKTE